MNKNTLCRIFVVSIIFLVSLSPLTILDVNAQEENTWTSLAPMQERRYGLGVAEVNGKIYAIGGYSGSSPFKKTTEEYNPQTNTWTTKTPMPTARSDFGITVYNNKIYCFGGHNSETLDVTEIYDPATDTWETKASMPTAEKNIAASTVGDTIYVITPKQVHYAYDPNTDSWISKKSMLSSLHTCVSVVLNGKIHVFGELLTHQIYDPQTDSWEYGEETPTNSYFPVAATIIGKATSKRIYVFGAVYYNFLYEFPELTGQSFDPKTGNWTMVATVSGHLDGGVAVIDDRIYLIGGGSFFMGGYVKATTTNDVYTPYLFGSIPQISITSPVNRIYNQTTTIPLEFTVNEPVSWMGYSLGGQTNVTITGNTNLTILTEGLHTLEVYVRDMAGDEGSSIVTFTVDVYPPVVFVLSPENKTYGDSNVLLNVEFEEPISNMMYSLDGLENVIFTEDITLSELEVGSHNVTVYATDLAGHTGISETIYFTIEPFPTTLVIASVAIIAVVGLGIFAYFKKFKN